MHACEMCVCMCEHMYTLVKCVSVCAWGGGHACMCVLGVCMRVLHLFLPHPHPCQAPTPTPVRPPSPPLSGPHPHPRQAPTPTTFRLHLPTRLVPPLLTLTLLVTPPSDTHSACLPGLVPLPTDTHSACSLQLVTPPNDTVSLAILLPSGFTTGSHENSNLPLTSLRYRSLAAK